MNVHPIIGILKQKIGLKRTYKLKLNDKLMIKPDSNKQ